jgi:serine O-acetyltransferase
MCFISTVLADLRRHVPSGGSPGRARMAVRALGTAFVHAGWHALLILRLAQGFHRLRLYPIGWLLYRLNLLLFGIDVHPAVRLGAGAWLPHPVGIVIHRRVTIGTQATLFPNITVGGRGGWDVPVLGNGVVLGAGSRVLGNLTLGDGVRVGANAVVTRSFPDGTTLAGVPARPLSGAERETPSEP